MSASFREWGAVLTFLTGLKAGKHIRHIHIKRLHDEEWTLKTNETHGNDIRTPQLPLAGLFDLYW